MPSKQLVHVALVGDRDADLADLAAGEDVVGVIAGLGRQVEGDREAGLALGQVAAGRARWSGGRRSGRRRCASPRGGRAREGGARSCPNDIWPRPEIPPFTRHGAASFPRPVFRLRADESCDSQPLSLAAARRRWLLAAQRRRGADRHLPQQHGAQRPARPDRQALRRRAAPAAAPTTPSRIVVGKRTRDCSYRTPVLGRDLEIAATERLLSGTPKPSSARPSWRSTCAPAAAPATSCPSSRCSARRSCARSSATAASSTCDREGRRRR